MINCSISTSECVAGPQHWGAEIILPDTVLPCSLHCFSNLYRGSETCQWKFPLCRVCVFIFYLAVGITKGLGKLKNWIKKNKPSSFWVFFSQVSSFKNKIFFFPIIKRHLDVCVAVGNFGSLIFLPGDQLPLKYVCVALGLRLEQGIRVMTVLAVVELFCTLGSWRECLGTQRSEFRNYLGFRLVNCTSIIFYLLWLQFHFQNSL